MDDMQLENNNSDLLLIDDDDIGVDEMAILLSDSTSSDDLFFGPLMGGSRPSSPEWPSFDGDMQDIHDMHDILSVKSDESFDMRSSDDDDDEMLNDEAGPENRAGNSSSPGRFDISLLTRCIEEGQATLNEIEDKHVCLVVGKTGSGKSTLIQGFAGKRFRAVEHATVVNGRRLTKTVYEPEEPLEGFEIGHDKASKTRTIKCFEYRSPEPECRSTYFIDSPGFEDTGGHEIDTATSVLLRQVAQRCRSLRFIIIISYTSLLDSRGQSMRGILKIIRSFVNDFKQQQKSFMFLFSHMPQVVGDSLNASYDLLSKEIEDLLHGSTDDDVKVVLLFLKKCLKNNFPHVQIFSPISSDFPSLLRFAERKLKPIHDTDRAGSCGLTLSSQLKLQAEVPRALLEVRTIFENTQCVDTKRVLEIYNTLRSLHEFIGSADIATSLTECRRYIDCFCDNERKLMEQKFSQGTELGAPFASPDIFQMKIAGHYLTDLTGMTEKSLFDRIAIQVKPLRDSTLEALSQGYWRAVVDSLEKLKTWAAGFPDPCQSWYSDVRLSVQDRLQNIAHRIQTVSVLDLCSADKDEIAELVEVFSIMSSCHRHVCYLVHHDIDISTISSLQETLCSSLMHSISAWKDDDQVNAKMRPIRYSSEELRVAASKARVLQSLQSNVSQEFDGLGKAILLVYCHVKDVVSEYFQDASTKWSSSNVALSEETFNQLNGLHVGAKHFYDLGSEWKFIQVSWNSIVANVRSLLLARATRVESLSRTEKTNGINQARSTLSQIQELQQFVLFDQLFDAQDKFMENVFISVCRNYSARMDSIRSQLKACFDLLDAGKDCISALESLKFLAAEVQEISILAPVICNGNAMGLDDYFDSRLKSYSLHLHRRGESYLATFEMASRAPSARASIRAETSKLDDLLHEITLVPSLTTNTYICEQANAITEKIDGALRQFVQLVTGEVANPNSFQILAYHLEALEDCRKLCFLGKSIPPFESLKDQLSAVVSNKAQAIESLIDTSAEWDEIYPLIVAFEEATAIDDFVDGQVSSRLLPLQKLREKEEADVESEVSILINRRDFQGISSLIGPMAMSVDPLKNQRFRRYEVHICHSLSRIMTPVRASLEASRLVPKSMKKIAEGMDTLRAADKEIGGYLVRNFRTDLNNLKQMVETKFNTFFFEFDEARRSSDLAQMAIAKSGADLFATWLEKDIPSDSVWKVHAMKRRYDDFLSSISREIQLFFDTGFRNEEKIMMLLSSLHRGASHDHPATNELGTVYRQTSQDIQDKLRSALEALHSNVIERECFEDGVAMLQKVVHAMNRGLSRHIDTSRLPFDCKNQLTEWRGAAESFEGLMVFEGLKAEESIIKLGEKMDKLKVEWPVTQKLRSWLPSGDRTYNKLLCRLNEKIQQAESVAMACVRTLDTSGLHVYLETLGLLVAHLGRHAPSAATALDAIEKRSITTFQDILSDSIKALNAGDFEGFQPLFPGIRAFVLDVPLVSKQAKLVDDFRFVNQLIFENIQGRVQALFSMIELKSAVVDFPGLRVAIQDIRAIGDFVADHCTLLYAEMTTANHLWDDVWLSKVLSLCKDHFSTGREFKNLQHCAILGVVPSADVKEIKRAYRSKAKMYHPDKYHPDKARVSGEDINAKFRSIKEAEEALVEDAFSRDERPKRAFDQEIRQIREHLLDKTMAYLQEQRYDAIENILTCLPNLREIKDLIEPEFDDVTTRREVNDLIRAHVEKTKTEVRTLCLERKYRDLNDTINDLKAMEESLKSHVEVFATSWNDGIFDDIEGEMKKLAKECRSYLSSYASAKENESEFRRSFLQLGCILFELPSMKSRTKALMVDVLEKCLYREWGFGYLFELGLSLQRGAGTTEDTDHIAHLILAEFSHFKEVLTMAWNTETVQKPVDDIVKYIEAESLRTPASSLAMNEGSLLASFAVFETEYNALLGEFIQPESDRRELVLRVMSICEKIRPACSVERWDEDIRNAIPKILGGVFAVFTILKSGESFNRIEASNAAAKVGRQILCKPHNIQILTLLYMFGCHAQSGTSLESQLLQIRTGEGKSMILGAAATVLGLLGFRVRCVCYSEYLSRRDFDSFLHVFDEFGLDDEVAYCHITKLSEEMTFRKGDIRSLTADLLQQRLGKTEASSAAEHEGKDGLPCAPIDGSIRTPKKSRMDQHPVSHGHKAMYESASVEKPDEDETSSASVGNTLLRRKMATVQEVQEILLVDEVDVFFGSDFYGKTYNQVAQVHEPEVRQILEMIWASFKQGGRRLYLTDIKSTQAYKGLVAKMQPFSDIVDSEISLMIDAVRHVDDEPYFLDSCDRIGYKVMDTVSYNVTMGYRTVFAYLKENDRGKLSDPMKTLDQVLCMNVSCGQFSYANVNPSRILGVSGTLCAMGAYEKSVLQRYGISRFVFLPSVYGKTNLHFDEAGDGICVEADQSVFFHRIQQEIIRATSANRAAIVFFARGSDLAEFQNSSFYRQLGRKRAILSEDMDAASKDFVIKKASTAGQVTICTAVFGRGTDFFCKDHKVEQNGGVHVIQTFLSSNLSEEIQIQGRTARQGKKGTYQLILLESDIQRQFGIDAFKDVYPKKDWYSELCRMRDDAYADHCKEMECNLLEATARDQQTHQYFDALLSGDTHCASRLFKEIYLTMKKRMLPTSVDIELGFVVDMTGSMRRCMNATNETIASLLSGDGSIMSRLSSAFPDIEFKLRIGAMGFRDLEDGREQFQENKDADGGHFNEITGVAIQTITNLTKDASGGYDTAEDIFGALHRCANWSSWSSTIKFIILMTDAPAHGYVPFVHENIDKADNFPHGHPNGHTAASAADVLLRKGIDLAFCSFNPTTTDRTEEALAKHFLDHDSNVERRDIIRIPLVSTEQVETASILGYRNQHIVFVLDDSGSMSHNWAGVEAAYQSFCSRRKDYQCLGDIVSVVQFDDTAIVPFRLQNIYSASRRLDYRGGGTFFTPAAQEAQALIRETPSTHVPVVIFMSDGEANEGDSVETAQIFSKLNTEVRRRWGRGLELHVIAFGLGLDKRQLKRIARSSKHGQIYSSADTSQLGEIFLEIATTSCDVASTLESEIGRRISDAVTDKISLEYLG